VIIAALTGVVNEVDIDLIRQYREEILMGDKHLKECQEKLTEICRKEFPREFENLQTIPGVKERSATSILSELGTDMKMFITAAALVSWCGLKTRNEEQNCFYSNFTYIQTVVRRKNAMKVKVAIAWKMLVAIWHVLNEGVPYHDYKKPEAITEGNS